MIGRRSIWDNKDVRSLLRYFIPTADDVGRFAERRCDDPDCQLFREMSKKGHYAEKQARKRQGIYVTTPGGKFLASGNDQDPARVAELMRKALKKWTSLSGKKRPGSTSVSFNSANGDQAGNQYPEDGLVLREFARDLPRETNIRSSRRNDWNQDYAWFRKEEARQFLPENPEEGDVHTVPEPLTMRLVRFHLVDFVLGQTYSFPKEAVEHAELRTEVKNVDGSMVHLRIRGSSRAEETGTWGVCKGHGTPSKQSRGYDGEILGKAVYNLKKEAFASFEMVSAGIRWGGTKHNSRCKDLMKNPIGFVFVLAPEDSPAHKVPPAKFHRGDYW